MNGPFLADRNYHEDDHFPTDLVERAKSFGMRGIEFAERKQFDEAIAEFTKSIETIPERASGYNNRAQTYQLKKDLDSALRDLNKAIELTKNRGAVAANAYSQRALIRRFQGEEDEALLDFQRAAHLGNQYAKHQVVALNPYAALCNQMLSEMFMKLQKGEDTTES